MPNFINLPAFTEDGDLHVVVETPRGSRAKFAAGLTWDHSSPTLRLIDGLPEAEAPCEIRGDLVAPALRALPHPGLEAR